MSSPTSPRVATGTSLLGYYGSPEVPGFGLSAIYTDQKFSLVMTDADGRQVACGDILRPDADEFSEVGVAVVQLLAGRGLRVQGSRPSSAPSFSGSST